MTRKAALTALVAAGLLVAMQAANAGDPASGEGEFSVLGTTDSGKALFLKLPRAANVEAAAVQTGEALGKILDARPALSGGFADSKANGKPGGRGGAMFTGTLKGKAVQGWIFCGPASDAKGMTASALYTATNAPKEELATLMAYLPAPVKMEKHDFSDGSGSIQFPEGWTTQTQSATYGVLVKGPTGQMVGIANRCIVNSPTGNILQMRLKTYQIAMQTYQMQMQNYQQQLLMHQRFPRTLAPREPVKPVAPDPERDMPGLIFCPYCAGPEEVLKTFYPISEKHGKNAGGPYSSLEKVLAVVPSDANPLIKDDKAGVAYLQMTDHVDKKDIHMRVLVRIETYPIQQGQDTWVIVFNTLRAPDATFDRDLPVMNDIMNSLTLDMDVVNRQIKKDGDMVRAAGEESQRQLLKRAKDFNQQQDERFQRFESQEVAQENARHDSNSDFIEMIRGVRDVYDTKTGEMRSVDLYHVNGIVNGMNDVTNDPGRFVQIPLRYER